MGGSVLTSPEIAQDIAGALSLILAAMFLAAVFHKVRVVARGSAAREPLLRRSAWRRQRATPLLLLAGIGELVTVVSLIALPAVGFALTAAFALLYSVQVWQLSESETCNCFGSLGNQDRASSLRRNAIITLMAAVALVASVVWPDSARSISGEALGGAVVAIAVLSAVAALNWVKERADLVADGHRTEVEDGQ